MNKLPRTEKLSYLWAFIGVAIAFAAQWFLDPWVTDQHTFWFFIPAVALVAWSGGFTPGLVAAALSVGAGLALLKLQTGHDPNINDQTGVLLFSVASLSILATVQGLRRSLRREIVSRPVVEVAPAPARRDVDRDRDRGFKSIFDNTFDAAIIAMDANRVVREWNVGATQITGWSRGEMVGRSADTLFSPDDIEKGEPGLEQLMAETTGRAGFSRWLQRRDGSQFLAEGAMRSMPGEIGESKGFIKVFSDLTSRIQKYEDTVTEMVTRAQDAEVLTYSMAHDMRQYTRGIANNTTMLIRDFGEVQSEGQAYAIKRLKENATRMYEMVEGILEHLRVGRSPISPKPVNLSALAEEAVQRVNVAMPDNNMHFIIQPGLWVKGDKELLALVFGNLFENAVKYGDGKVIFGRDASKDAYYVRDEGPGFEAQYCEKIFKLFERLHGQDKPGTGIGLPNVKRIIERHGGKIWAESEPGKGATFYFTLKAMEHSPVGTLR